MLKKLFVNVLNMGRVITFIGRIIRSGTDPYGEPRLIIYIPKKLHEKVKDLEGKEIVIELKELDTPP